MASTNESGHAVNAKNFNDLVITIDSSSVKYLPPADDIKLEVLKKDLTELDTTMKALSKAEAMSEEPLKNIGRHMDTIDKKAREIIKTMEVLNLPKDIIVTAKGWKDLITGDNVSKNSADKKKRLEKAKPGEVVPDGNSVSQQGRQQKVANLRSLIDLAESSAAYKLDDKDPHSAKNLKAFLAEVTEADKAAVLAEGPLIKYRQQRDKLLYAEGTGILDKVKRVKKEIERTKAEDESLFVQVSRLSFRKF